MQDACWPDPDTVSLEIKRDEHGRITSGPVLWTLDFGQGRVSANTFETPEWDKWARDKYNKGILIMPLLPNSTAVTALMDYLFGPYKGACRDRSQVIFADHVLANCEKVNAIKEKMSRGEEVTNEEKKAIKQAVKMDPSDVGRIVFGELTEDRLPHPESPYAIHFTKDKIAHGAKEVSNILLCAY